MDGMRVHNVCRRTGGSGEQKRIHMTSPGRCQRDLSRNTQIPRAPAQASRVSRSSTAHSSSLGTANPLLRSSPDAARNPTAEIRRGLAHGRCSPNILEAARLSPPDCAAPHLSAVALVTPKSAHIQATRRTASDIPRRAPPSRRFGPGGSCPEERCARKGGAWSREG